MIIEYQIKNFKCFADTGPLTLGHVTVLLGGNNSGKSSLLQPLQMLAQTAAFENPKVRLATHSPRDFGRYFEWVHGGKTELDFGCRLVLDKLGLDTATMASQRRPRIDWQAGLDLTFGLAGSRGKWKRPILKSVDMALKCVTARPPEGISKEMTWKFAFDRNDNISANFNGESIEPRGLRMRNFLPRDYEWEKPVSLYVSDYAVLQMPRYFYSLDRPFRAALDLVQVDPVRPAIPRVLHSNDVDPRENSCSTTTILASLYRFKNSSRVEWQKFRGYMNRWLGQELGFVREFDLVEIDPYRELFAIHGKDAKTGATVNLADTGYGVAQVLPVLLQLYFSRPGQLVLIEEPELHLNPAAQRVLFDLVHEFASTGRQIVVETHSEHFLLRLRRRSIEQPELRQMIRLYFVERVEGHSALRELPLTEDGRLDNWPEGFLDEAFEESVELMKQLDRRHAEETE
jgi:predicted ATPase